MCMHSRKILKGGNYYGNDYIAAACLCRLMTSEPNPAVLKSVRLCLLMNLLKTAILLQRVKIFQRKTRIRPILLTHRDGVFNKSGLISPAVQWVRGNDPRPLEMATA